MVFWVSPSGKKQEWLLGQPCMLMHLKPISLLSLTLHWHCRTHSKVSQFTEEIVFSKPIGVACGETSFKPDKGWAWFYGIPRLNALSLQWCHYKSCKDQALAYLSSFDQELQVRLEWSDINLTRSHSGYSKLAKFRRKFIIHNNS